MSSSVLFNNFKRENYNRICILTSLSRSLELSASRGATDDVVSLSDARPLSSEVPGSWANVNEFCNKKKTKLMYCTLDFRIF